MKKNFAVFGGIVFFLAVMTANAENSVILEQKTPPLKITQYTAKYQPEARGTYISHPDQIEHTVKYQNVSGKVVVALQIGLASFDSFNNFMDKLSGWSVETIALNAEAKGTWAQSPYGAFKFQKYGTGVAFVNAVRFDDGSIWQADPDEILTGLQKFEKGLKKEDIEEKKK